MQDQYVQELKMHQRQPELQQQKQQQTVPLPTTIASDIRCLRSQTSERWYLQHHHLIFLLVIPFWVCCYPSANSKTLITLTVRVSAKYSSVWCLPTISTIPPSRDWHNLNFDCGKKHSCQPKWYCLPQAFRQHRVVHFLSSTPSYKQSLSFDLGAKATDKKEICCWSSYRQAFPQRLRSRLGRTTLEQAIIFRL